MGEPKNDRMIRLRVPSEVYDALVEESSEAGTTLAPFVRGLIVSRHRKRKARLNQTAAARRVSRNGEG